MPVRVTWHLIIAEIQALGAKSLREIAAGLNERGIPTARHRRDGEDGDCGLTRIEASYAC